jgi:hypothetical protein
LGIDVDLRQPVKAEPTPPVTPAALGTVQQQATNKTISNKRGCLYTVGVFVLLTVVVLLLAGIASDGVVGCCAISVIPESVSSFFVFRVKKATV